MICRDKKTGRFAKHEFKVKVIETGKQWKCSRCSVEYCKTWAEISIEKDLCKLILERSRPTLIHKRFIKGHTKRSIKFRRYVNLVA